MKGRILYIPEGVRQVLHQAQVVQVAVTPGTSAELERQRAAIQGRGKQAYFDFNGDDGPASFWVERFSWQDGDLSGVYAEGEWSDSGYKAIESKGWRHFKPAVHLERGANGQCRIVCNERAKPNMGGLTNDEDPLNPLPLWAKNADGRSPSHQNNITMTTTLHRSSGVEVVRTSARDTMKAYAALVAKNTALPHTAENARLKAKLALEAGEIYAGDISGNRAFESMPIEAGIEAADYSDPNQSLGILSGTLTLQKSLDLFKYEYPVLGAIWGDFSGEVGMINQTTTTRITLTPAIQTYNPDVDASGRPKGWDTVSAAQTVDVPVTLDEYIGIPIVFSAQTLASTFRNLFAEQAPMAMNALGGHFTRKILSLMTPENFNAYKGNSATGGSTTSGSKIITVTSTANMFPAQRIAGTGIPVNTYIARVVNGTTAELTRPATATNGSLTFALNGDKVPNLFPTYAKALVDFDLDALDDIGGIFDLNEVPMQHRGVLLSGRYYRRLRSDDSLNMFFAAQQMPEIITEGRLPKLTGFAPYNAPYFPTDNNKVGFAFHRGAVVIKTRLPVDLGKATGIPTPGVVTTVTDPDTNISLALVQYVNHQQGYAESRIEGIVGAAPGDRRGGLVLTSE